MTDKAREEFEAWLVKSNRSCASARNDSGGYNHYGAQSCWEAWQASRRVGAAALDAVPGRSKGDSMTPDQKALFDKLTQLQQRECIDGCA